MRQAIKLNALCVELLLFTLSASQRYYGQPAEMLVSRRQSAGFRVFFGSRLDLAGIFGHSSGYAEPRQNPPVQGDPTHQYDEYPDKIRHSGILLPEPTLVQTAAHPCAKRGRTWLAPWFYTLV